MSGIANPAKPYFKDGAWGWDGAVWRKLPMVWGYSDTWADSMIATDVVAGAAYLSFTAVDPGIVLVVTNFMFFSSQANADLIALAAFIQGGTRWLKVTSSVTADTSIEAAGDIILKEGEYLRARYEGAAAGDDFQAHAFGYEMKIAE